MSTKWFLTGLVFFAAAVTSSTLKGDHTEPGYQLLDDEEKQFITKLDTLRASLKLPQIVVEERIVKDCRDWAANRRAKGILNHGSSQENGAVGNHTGSGTFSQWRHSGLHNAFLCNRSNTVCGIGHSGNYWFYRAAPAIEQYKGTNHPNGVLFGSGKKRR